MVDPDTKAVVSWSIMHCWKMGRFGIKLAAYAALLFLMLFLPQCKPIDLCNPMDPLSDCGQQSLILNAVKKQTMAAATAAPPCSPCRVFVTASTFTGALGGIAGADSLCMIDSAKPATGTYKALLSFTAVRAACTTLFCTGGPSEHTDWILRSGISYIRATDSTLIGTADANDILTSESNAISVAVVTVWLGLSPGWMPNPGNNCSGWTDGTGVSSGASKDVSGTGIDTTFNNASINTFALVCEEQ